MLHIILQTLKVTANLKYVDGFSQELQGEVESGRPWKVRLWGEDYVPVGDPSKAELENTEAEVNEHSK